MFRVFPVTYQGDVSCIGIDFVGMSGIVDPRRHAMQATTRHSGTGPGDP